MTNMARGLSQLNIDILMSGSHRDFDVWLVSTEQLPAVNTWFKLIEIILLICTMATIYFFGGRECVGHSFAYVAHFVFLRDVWIRAQRAAVASTNLATHIPNLATRLPDLATHLPDLATHLPNLATRLPAF